jgi:hypothetical protein
LHCRDLREDRGFEFADGVTAQQILLRQRDAEAVLDRHHAHGECHRVQADVVDETGVGGDAADVDVPCRRAEFRRTQR